LLHHWACHLALACSPRTSYTTVWL
jgi:hypothetical protein